MRLVATAGHVDHGKSTLVRALTGVDPDRWQEEKSRGMTIDLGFASTTLPDGVAIEFIDVPGHVRFLRNMLAGVGSVRACLFVVDAIEGWKPQSEEHLRILEMVGVTHGVVALTKVAASAAGDVSARCEEVRSRLAGTFLAQAPIVGVDALAGIGLDDLRSALATIATLPELLGDAGRPRLWIDRAFSIRGSGTVVTGTNTGGAIAVGDHLDLLPQGLEVRVRGLQRHGEAVDSAPPGGRLALNITGVSHREVRRGDVLVRAGQWVATTTFDASLRVLTSLGHAVTRRGAHLAYIGSRELAVRLQVLAGGRELPAGATGFVRLHLDSPVPLLPGDRYVLREVGRAETVGGGEILDVAPVLAARDARPTKCVERVVAERGWVDVDELERLTGARVAATVDRLVVSAEAHEAAVARLRSLAEVGSGVADLDDLERALLPSLGLAVVDGRVRRPDAPESTAVQRHPYQDVLDASPFAPPAPEDCGYDRRDLRALVRNGQIVERNGVYFSTGAVEAAARAVADLLVAEPGGFSASAFREALGTSRKYAIPLLEQLDALGVTRRRGDLRVGGPRLARS